MQKSNFAFLVFALLLSSICVVEMPERAVAGFATGGQDVLLDPARPVIYWVGAEGNDLKFMNSSTGETIETIVVGNGPSAACLDPNGTTLYVPIPGSQCIIVVDVTSRSIVRNISLTFSPLSMGLDGNGYAYISGTGSQSGWMFSLDMSTWTVKNSMDLFTVDLVVEVNPEGTILLAIEREVIPAHIMKYGISAGSFTYIGAGDTNAYVPKQIAVDWIRGRLYIAPTVSTEGIIVISTDTLGQLGSLPTDYFPSCVFVTVDGEYVYGTGEEFDADPAKRIWMYNATDGSCMGTMNITLTATSLVVSHDLRSAYIGMPIQRISLLPLVNPLSPADDSVLSYTPRCFSVEFSGGLPSFEEQNASAYIDTTPLHLDRDMDIPTRWVYKATFNSTMAEGYHTFSVSQLWNNELIWGNTTYKIDRDDPQALGLSLNPKNPASGSIVPSAPLEIISQVVYSSFDQYFEGGVISLDGTNLSTSVSSNTISAIHDSNISTGPHNISSRVFWDGGLGTKWANWTFTAMNGPLLTPIYPMADQVLTVLPDRIEVDVDRRDFQGTLSSPRISLDGVYYYSTLTDDDKMITNLTKMTKAGNHTVTATITWAAGQVAISWNFELDMFVGPNNEVLVQYQYEHEFRMLLPNGTGWILEKDSVIDGVEYPVVMYGPTYSGFRTNIIVTGGRDSSAEESETYLQGKLDEAISGLEDSGYSVVPVVPPEIRHINNLTAYVAVIQLQGYGIYQAVGIIASEEHESVWVVILSMHIARYSDYSDMFDRMIDSFTLDDESGSSLSVVELAAIGIGIAVVAIGVVVAIHWRSRRRMNTRPPQV